MTFFDLLMNYAFVPMIASLLFSMYARRQARRGRLVEARRLALGGCVVASLFVAGYGLVAALTAQPVGLLLAAAWALFAYSYWFLRHSC